MQSYDPAPFAPGSAFMPQFPAVLFVYNFLYLLILRDNKKPGLPDRVQFYAGDLFQERDAVFLAFVEFQAFQVVHCRLHAGGIASVTVSISSPYSQIHLIRF